MNDSRECRRDNRVSRDTITILLSTLICPFSSDYLVNLPTAQDCLKPTDSAFRRTQIEERTKRKAKEGTRKEGNRRPEGVRKTAWRNKTMPERRRAVRRISAGSRFVAVLGQSYSGWHGSPVGMQALHGSDADAS